MEFSPWDRPPLTAARPDSTMGGENALWEETDMDIQGLQKMTLLDYPGRVACTVFLGGCDLRCPFCHNGGLVLGPMPAELDSEELLAFLRKRRGLLDGVCVTGGEPLLRPELEGLLEGREAQLLSSYLDHRDQAELEMERAMLRCGVSIGLELGRL